MTLDRTTLFAWIRNAPFGGRLTTQQVEGTEALLDSWDREGTADQRHLAYVLASVFHETGGRMAPVRETFATSDAQAIRRLDAAWAAGRLRSVKTPYWRAGWFGRGPIQVTHEHNYRKMGEALGVDLVANPNLLLDPVVGARSAVVGMVKGLFTSKCLADYFGPGREDPEGARRIVNGTDKASLIAGYYKNFLDSLEAASAAGEKVAGAAAGWLPASSAAKAVPPAVVEAAKPDGADLKKDQVALGGMLAGLGGLGGVAAVIKPILEGVSSPWALGAFAVVVIAALLVLSGRIQLKIKGGV